MLKVNHLVWVIAQVQYIARLIDNSVCGPATAQPLPELTSYFSQKLPQFLTLLCGDSTPSLKLQNPDLPILGGVSQRH